MNIFRFSGLIGLSILTFGCGKNLPAVGSTKVQNLANEWWVTLKLGDSDLLGKFAELDTYNTAADDDSLWIDDLGNTRVFKTKVAPNLANMSFSITNAPNEYDTNLVNISNARIIPKGGHSKTGRITDSIYMEVKLSDNPNTYIIAGTARTHYSEDDYMY